MVWAREHPKICGVLPSSTHTIFLVKVVFVWYFHNPSFIPNLKLLSSAVVEISRGPKIFGLLPWPRLSSVLVLKVVFWKHYSTIPSYIPDLKSLGKLVAEISRGPTFLGEVSPLAQTLPILVPKVASDTLLPKPKLCTKFEVTIFNSCRNKQLP